MLLPIDDQVARAQLDFVIEQIQRYRSRQKRGVYENTFSERYVKGHRFWLAEQQGCRRKRFRNFPIPEGDLGIGNRQFRFVNEQSRFAVCILCEGDLPWALTRPPVLDAMIKEGVTDYRQQKRQDKMFQRPI